MEKYINNSKKETEPSPLPPIKIGGTESTWVVQKVDRLAYWEEACPNCGAIAEVLPDPKKEWLDLKCIECGRTWQTYRSRNASQRCLASKSEVLP